MKSISIWWRYTLLTTLMASTTSHAGARGPCADLQRVSVTFRTGEDGLHDSSDVVVLLTTKTGEYALQHVQGPLASKSKTSHSLAFKNPEHIVNSCDITRVRVHMISHPDNAETDTWHMNGIALHGYSETDRYAYYFAAAGNPLKRFAHRSTWWEQHE